AWYGAGYWSLVALTWIYSLGQFIASWFMVKWRPGLPRRAEGVRSLLAFGGNLTGSGFISYLQRNFDNVLVGWYWGAVPLGLYSRAYSLLTLPLRQLNYPMSGVAISAMSRLQDDPERQARYYLRASNLIMWLSAPLTGFVFVAAEPLIVLTLGPKWRDAAPVFQLLAISALFQPVYNATGWLFVSRGRVDRLFKLTIYTCPIIIGSFVLGLPFGIRGVAMSYSLILLAILPWIFKYTFEGTALNLRRFGKVLVLPLSVAVMAILAGMASMHLVRFHGDILRIAVAGGAFAAVYAASLLLPPVRKEINSLTALIRELRPQRATTAS
ncbi:MAG: oligosaccharide flippase family protein, partial [Terriglobales bacterium]